MQRKQTGFTLVEMLIVLALAGILAAVAFPSYTAQVRKGKRAEAKTALMSILHSQEKFRANCPQYATVLTAGTEACEAPSFSLAGPVRTTSGLYSLALTSGNATSFVATATAVAGTPQAKDTACLTMTLSQSQGTVTTAPGGCW